MMNRLNWKPGDYKKNQLASAFRDDGSFWFSTEFDTGTFRYILYMYDADSVRHFISDSIFHDFLLAKAEAIAEEGINNDR